ncbi:MAG: MBL fold metallo-hydrolase [bacterium]|nr:MBL fold metallo-hydrolase [bacterium]
MSLITHTYTLGELDTNTYLVLDEVSDQAVLIDPADQGSFLSEEILRHQADLQAIILTHGHFDHLLGLLELVLNFPVPVMLHPADLPLLKKAQASAVHWLKHQVDPVPTATQDLSDQQEIMLGQHRLRVLHTPGHTPGSICLMGEEIFFTGDTLFKDGVGATNHAYSKSLQLSSSLELIKSYTGKWAYPGHGEGFFI